MLHHNQSKKNRNQNNFQLFTYQRLMCLITLYASKGKRKQNFTYNWVRVQIDTISLKDNMEISIKISAYINVWHIRSGKYLLVI